MVNDGSYALQCCDRRNKRSAGNKLQQMSRDLTYQEQKKCLVVAVPNTVVDPGAMMILHCSKQPTSAKPRSVTVLSLGTTDMAAEMTCHVFILAGSLGGVQLMYNHTRGLC